jgi:cell division protein FtsB
VEQNLLLNERIDELQATLEVMNDRIDALVGQIHRLREKNT